MRRLRILALVFAVYYIGGKLGLSVPFTHTNVSPVWPPAGISLAALSLFGYAVWPAIWLSAFAVNFFSEIPHLASLGMATGNCFSALVAYWVFTRLDGHGTNPLGRVRGVLSMMVAAAVGPLVSSTVGVTSLVLAGAQPWTGFGSAWLVWWLGDAMGVIIFAPLLLAGLSFVARQRLPEKAALLATTAFVSTFIFGNRWIGRMPEDVLAFAVFPFIVWAAIRFGVGGSAVISNVVSPIAVWATSQGLGPFTRHGPLVNATMLQLYLAVVSLTGLLLAAAVAERVAAEDALEMQRRLQTAEKLAAAGRLAASIAHEINNPLEALTNLLYLLRSAPELSPDNRHLAEMAEREITRVSHIARHTLGFYRDNETPRLVRVSAMLDELLEIYGPRIETKGLQVVKTCEDAQTTAVAGEMRQLLTNVLLNAVEASPQGGRLFLRIRKTRRWSDGTPVVRITIADQGPGISPSARRQMFEPFFTTKNKGTGLGLWVVKEIVQRHRGNIFLRSSTRAGRSGTCVVILLPVEHNEVSIEAGFRAQAV